MPVRGDAPGSERATLSRQFLQVPRHEWTMVRRGFKTEFRLVAGEHRFEGVEMPTPVILYPWGNHGAGRLMVLEAHWQEPLGAINEESLANEGCDSLREFRRRWVTKRRRAFDYLRVVYVFRVRVWTPEDEEGFQRRFWEHLYGGVKRT